jgi:coenzyme PQQ synthesis protein D (PqqD)
LSELESDLSTRSGRPARRADVWLRQSGEENAVYDPVTKSLHLLNDTALAIWELCDGKTRPDEMIDAICELSGMHLDVVTEDVERILAEFDDAGLLAWVT